MADFKGMSILMNMRDVGIDRTMKQIKGQFKTLNSEMKRSNADFKNSEKSLQNFNQRTKELNKAIDVTENSMKDISNQLKKMTLEEQRTSAEAEKLRQEYSKQHKNLSMYQRQLTSTQNEMKTFNSTNKRAVFSMEKINQTLGTMRKQLNIADTSFKNSGKSVKSYENYLKQLNTVISKHQNTIKVLEGRYKKVVKEQGEMSHEAIDLKQKIQQEKQALQQLNSQYKQTSAEAKRFSFEQKSATQSMSEIRQKISQVAQSLQISASKFKMTGQTAQAYKARISDLNNGMKQQKLIVQNLSRQYDYAKKQYGETSVEAQKLNAELVEERVKLKDLNGQLKQTTQAHNRLEMEQQQGIASMTEIRQKMSGFNDTLSLSRSNLSRAGESLRAYKGHLDTLNTNLSQQRTVLRELNNQYKIVAQTQGKNSAEARELSGAITQQKIRMNELESEIDQTAQSYKKLATQQKQAQALSATGFGRGIQSVNKYNDSIKNVGMSMRSVGTGSLIYMTMPAVAAMGGAIKTSVDWEQALAGIAKTTDMIGKELEGMGNEITAMSNKMPFAATEIAGVAEAAGQLGVKKSEITDFTETMMNMSVATNLSADEAATEFARFSNAAGMPIEDVDRLGAAVVNLGNTTATTEKEIVEMGQRLAGAGSQAGFSGDEIMSVSAAMSSVGIEAEAGGTAMTQIFNKMTKATAEGGETLDNFAKTSGMSAKEFSSTWENNPTKALSAFVKGLGDTKGGAKGVLSALDDVGIKGIREADTIRRMSNNHKVLDDALKTGAEGWKENTALTDEAAIRYETMGSKLTVLKNTFVNFLRTIGDAVAPIVIKLADTLTALFKRLQNTSNITKIAITAFTLLAAAIPPILISGGLLLTLLTNMAKSMMFLNGLTSGGGILAGLKAAFSSILSPITQVVTKIPLIGTALSALSGPIGWITLAIVGIGTALVVAYKKSETFRNVVNGVVNAVVSAFKTMWSVLKTIFDGISQMFQGNFTQGANILDKILPPNVVNGIETTVTTIRTLLMQVFTAISSFVQQIGTKITSFWAENGPMIMQALTNIWNFIKTVFNGIWSVIKPILDAIGKAITFTFNKIVVPIIKFAMNTIWSTMKLIWPLVKILIVDTWNNIKGIIQGALDIILGIVKAFGALFTGNWSELWNAIKQIFSGAITLVWNLVQLYFIGKILKVVRMFGSVLKSVISTSWKFVKNVFTTVLKAIWSFVKTIFNAMLKFIKSIFNSIKTVTSTVWNFIKKIITNSVKTVLNTVRSIFNTMKKVITTIFNAVKNFLIKIWNTIKSKVTGFAKALWSGVKNTFNLLRKGVTNIFNGVKNNLVNTWNTIKNKVTDIASKLWGSVKKTFNNMKNGLKVIIDKIKGFIDDMVKGIKKGLNKLIEGVNWVGKKLGMPKIPKFEKFSTGTESTHTQNIVTNGKLNQDTVATVGDKGKGNGPGGFRHETIIPPKGKPFITPNKDTTMPLSKGTKILNGAQTYSNMASSPKFSTGTLFGMGGSSKKNKNKGMFDGLGESLNNGWGAIKGVGEQTWEGAKAAGKKASEVVGNVSKYLSSPGKLVDKVLKSFGVNFDFVKGDIMGGMMKGMYKKLKDSVNNLFKGWLEEDAGGGGGDGSSFTKFGKVTPYSPNKPVPGYPTGFNGGKHFGIDYATPSGTTLKATNDGKVSKLHDHGGGTVAKLLSGKFTQFFMHLSNVLKTGKVKQGEAFAKTGNSGAWTTGPHLHYQVERGNSPFVTNKNTMDPEKYLAGNGGGKKGAKAWKIQIRRAAKEMNVKVGSSDVDGIASLIIAESGGDAGVTQKISDINSAKGTPAKGLLQYVPSTFKAYAKKGHTNINSGYDQLLAFFNNKNWKRDYNPNGGWGPTGARKFATGGKVFNGLYQLGEEGYPEWIIPTDPSRADDSMKLLALAAQDIDSKNKRNKRPNQMRTPSTGGSYSQNSGLEQKIDVLISLMSKLVESNDTIANKDFEPIIDPRGMNASNHEQEAINKATRLLY